MKKSTLPTSKFCRNCLRILPMADFMTRNGQVKYSQCLLCRRENAKKKMRKRHLHDPSEVRQYLLGIMGGRCTRCGYDEFVGSLEFHHIDPTLKTSDLSRLINQFCYGGTTAQWKLLEIEALKCAVLCSNCHQALHQGQWKNLLELRRKSRVPTSLPLPIPT